MAAGALLTACWGGTLPDPRLTAERWAAAAARGDAEAMHALLDARSRRELGARGVRERVADARAELARQAAALRAPDLLVETRAVVRFDDGEEAVVAVEQDGRLRVGRGAVLPVGGTSPEQVLESFRVALRRRSWPLLAPLLTRERRSEVERGLAALVEGLEAARFTEVQVDGDTARIELPGGHWVRLRREDGVWRVEDFE